MLRVVNIVEMPAIAFAKDYAIQQVTSEDKSLLISGDKLLTKSQADFDSNLTTKRNDYFVVMETLPDMLEAQDNILKQL